MHLLRVGENKILNALKEKPKTYTEIRKKTKLSHSILSNYLKNLRRSGLIEHDFETKKYYNKKISYASLLFDEISNFMEDYLKNASNKKIKNGMSISLSREKIINGWLILADPVKFIDFYSQAIKQPELSTLLLSINERFEDFWDSHLFKEFKSNERDVLTSYQRFLLECIKEMVIANNSSQWKVLYKLQESIARNHLEKEFPDVSIPDKMVQIKAKKETANKLREIEKIQSIIIKTFNPEELELKLATINDNFRSKKSLNKKVASGFEEKLDFLNDSTNKKIFKEYLLKRESKRPKILLINMPWGFEEQLYNVAQQFPKLYQQKFDESFPHLIEYDN